MYVLIEGDKLDPPEKVDVEVSQNSSKVGWSFRSRHDDTQSRVVVRKQRPEEAELRPKVKVGLTVQVKETSRVQNIHRHIR